MQQALVKCCDEEESGAFAQASSASPQPMSTCIPKVGTPRASLKSGTHQILLKIHRVDLPCCQETYGTIKV